MDMNKLKEALWRMNGQDMAGDEFGDTIMQAAQTLHKIWPILEPALKAMEELINLKNRSYVSLCEKQSDVSATVMDAMSEINKIVRGLEDDKTNA